MLFFSFFCSHNLGLEFNFFSRVKINKLFRHQRGALHESRVSFALALLRIGNCSLIIHSRSFNESIEIDHTGHLCMLLRTDGVKAMSHGFLGGKQKMVVKFANLKNHSQSAVMGAGSVM